MSRKNWIYFKSREPFVNGIDFKAMYYAAAKRVKSAIRSQKNKSWNEFLSEIGPNFVSSRKAWQKINSTRSNQSTKSRIPCLYDSGFPITENTEKANIFKEILKNTFREKMRPNSIVILNKRQKNLS